MSIIGRKAVVVPCSGIGKTYGTVAREAAYLLTEDLRPSETSLVALSRLVMGDAAAQAEVAACPAITLDGCKLACATKMVTESGGTVAQALDMLGAFRRHREYKPQGIAELNEGGRKLAEAVAEEASAIVDGLLPAAPAPGETRRA